MATENKRMRNLSATEAQWSSANPILLDGEIAFSSDVTNYKVGNGVDTWANLSYWADDVTARVRWQGPWVDGTYERNDMVRDDPYTMIANKDTSDRAGPVNVGTEAYLYDGSDPTVSLTAKTLLVGNTYTASTAVKVTGYRVYTVAGNYYSIYLKDLSTSRVTELVSFTATETGWTENGASGMILDAGVSFELAVFVQEPDPTPVTFTGNWDYETPNNVIPPGSGQIAHASKALDTLSIHKTDNDGTDRSVELLSISPGDTIETASVRWAVSLVVDQGTYIDYTVSPQLQSSPTGVVPFVFETISSTPITVLADPDYYLGNTEVRPFYSIDGAARVLTDDAYNIDLKVQPVSLSPDWDVVAVSGTGGGGSSGGSSFTGLSDTPSDYTGQAGKSTVVNQTEDGLEFGATVPYFAEFHDPTGNASWRIHGTTLECWGLCASAANGTTNFPKTFMRRPQVMTSQSGGGSSSGVNNPGSITTTSFVNAKRSVSNQQWANTSNTSDYYAIGEWDGIS